MKEDDRTRLAKFFDLLFRIDRRVENQGSEKERRLRGLRTARENLREVGMLSPSMEEVFDNCEERELSSK